MNLSFLKQVIAPHREAIVRHPLYDNITGLEDLQIFTGYHVYAVWDFMSLLKKLQQELTCVSTPWYPKGSASTRYLINEIVLGEESDIDLSGNRVSHFELYLQAMEQLGASILPVKDLIRRLSDGESFRFALNDARIPASSSAFCYSTFELIENAPTHVLAAVFTFGREDLIPDMFHELVGRLSDRYPDRIQLFKYYLERHIEVDGDHHSMLALQMVEELCGDDPQKWQEATEASVATLTNRKALWDGILKELQKNKAIANQEFAETSRF